MVRKVRIKGKESDWYEEAIFMMKSGRNDYREEEHLSEYANQLIGKYMKIGQVDAAESSIPKSRDTNDWIDYFFWISLGALGIVLTLFFLSFLS